MLYGFIAGLAVMAAGIIGSAVALVFKRVSHRANDCIIGYAAGVMLAAAFVGLLPNVFYGQDVIGIIAGISGIAAGAVSITFVDRFVPHMHPNNREMDENSDKRGRNTTLLIVIAVAIHNIPEGLATGISFSQGITDSAFLVAVSMAVQKLPEGLIVTFPLLASGMKKGKAFLLSCLVALMMLPGLAAGVLLGALPPLLAAFFYAFTFGAIIYVVSDEIIPESHHNGFERWATFSLIGGILTVLLIEMLI